MVMLLSERYLLVVLRDNLCNFKDGLYVNRLKVPLVVVRVEAYFGKQIFN